MKQIGKTAQQMINAPHGATFVWPVERSKGYAIHLARYLNRGDLKIVSAQDAVHQSRNSTIVLDHACEEHLDYDLIRRLKCLRKS